MRKFEIRMIGLVMIVAAAAAFSVAQPAPKPEKDDLAAMWTGYTIMGDGSRGDIELSFEKAEDGYSGKVELLWVTPELPLNNIVFEDGKLTCEFELMDDDGIGSQLIKIELTLDKETLKGHWFDAEGNSDIIELTLKKQRPARAEF